MSQEKILLKKVKVHNLKEIDLELKTKQLIVFTGVSGSGKSSLAFDTIYTEGQRRYIESLSTYARRHLGELPKPDAEAIIGISPTIAIEQKTAGKNPRSTVGTTTGIYDFLRVLYARVGIKYCPLSKELVMPRSIEEIIQDIKQKFQSKKIILLSPYAKGKKGEFKEDFEDLLRKGFTKVRVDEKFFELGEEIPIDGSFAHSVDIVIDRLDVEDNSKIRLTESLGQAFEIGKGVASILDYISNEEVLYSQHAYSPKSGLSYGPLEPQDFSFNHPSGMCTTCQGLGRCQEFNLKLLIDEDKSIADDCCQLGSSYETVRYKNIYDNLAKLYKFSVHTPWKKLSKVAKDVFLYGIDKRWVKMEFTHPIKKTTWTEYVHWEGILHEARKRFQEAKSDIYRKKILGFMTEETCSSCKGEKLKPYPAATLIGGKRIAEITKMTIGEALVFLKNLLFSKQEKTIAEGLLQEIEKRLFFLQEVGLHYLSLDRTAPTLSGGESQRVRLASQVGSGLVGAIYVLDEPSIGLHPRDNLKLLKTLKELRDQGNTVIVVEHDEETIREADYIVDIGPEAGERGGKIVAQGTVEDILKAKESLTGAYLSYKLKIPIPLKRRALSKQFLTIEGAAHHNLKDLTVKLPLGVFIAITGVSGSGKSSLITDIVYPALANKLQGAKLPVGKHACIKGIENLGKVIAIDQSPIGKTPRSNAATYVKLFDEIRDLFCQLPESMAHGYKSSRFSFNLKEGSCPHCLGMGMTKIDMDFMEDEWILCQHCKGKRFDANTLLISYRNKNIHDILEMTVSEADLFFANFPKIKAKTEILKQVGLDYLRIGQPSPTLSGGEAQRIKLAKELSRPKENHTFYILDEPTTGLHFHDIAKLNQILQLLVDKGHTVLIIEHNMDLVKTADWVIELGPEGGGEGGFIIAEGRPEKISQLSTPTATSLKSALKPSFSRVKNTNKDNIQKDASLHLECRTQKNNSIIVKGASQNNLKKIDIEIPRGKITLCTGPSGSGKSSFAFETLYAEGQRRYIESLSSFARQFVKQMPKPKFEQIEGLSAAIAIEQKNHAGNPRSTVGTMTEAYDYLRILFAHLGTAYCPQTQEEIKTISKEYVVKKLMSLEEKTRLHILSPVKIGRQEAFDSFKERLQKQGFLRIRLNKIYYELDDEKIPYDKQRKNECFLVIDRLILSPSSKERLFDAIEQATLLSSGTVTIDTQKQDLFFNLAFAVESTGKSYPPITPHLFSFNTEQGMCLECEGLGFQYGIDLRSYKEIMKLSALDLCQLLWKENSSSLAMQLFLKVLKEKNIDSQIPLKKLSQKNLNFILNGASEENWVKEKQIHFQWCGINKVLARSAQISSLEIRFHLIPILNQHPCFSCEATRLNPLARHVKIRDLNIADVCHLSIEKALTFIASLQEPCEKHPFLLEPWRQLIHRLKFLKAIGLGYLALNRSAPTLSGGEAQRIRLARQLGTGLTGCLYILDEPTIGLHPYNNALLNNALKNLCEMGNTLVLVEHDPMTVEIADYLLDFGPGAGKLGGEITAHGTLKQIKKNPASLTGAYLSGRKKISIPNKRRSSKTYLKIKNGSIHNLKNIEIDIPLQVFTCITGPSGSGKSSLMDDLIRPAIEKGLLERKNDVLISGALISGIQQFDKMLVVDQSPIGHTIRSDVSTYVDLLFLLRHFFSMLPEAQIKGLQPKHFSFNHPKGMCSACLGLGVQTVEMQFLPPVKVKCEGCKGLRLNPLSLTVRYKGKNLGEILNLSVKEAFEFLAFLPKASRILETLLKVGLGYLTLGQEIVSLSGGEAQRIRLSKELAKRSTGKTLYLFDEPTIGLHSEDISKLLEIFHVLVEKGNTLITIEHNLDIISNADFVIDLGPDAGEEGGKLIAQGPPEVIASHPTSHTATYLASHLKKYPTLPMLFRIQS